MSKTKNAVVEALTATVRKAVERSYEEGFEAGRNGMLQELAASVQAMSAPEKARVPEPSPQPAAVNVGGKEPYTRGLPKKIRAAFRANETLTASEIAQRVGTTRESIKVTKSYYGKKGTPILVHVGQGRYALPKNGAHAS